MFTEGYYTQQGENYLFSKQQGSDFAKGIAGDFNPLHDASNSRFCIPGDLLFSVLLSKYGVRQQMTFDFQGMVKGDMPIRFIQNDKGIDAENEKQKTVLSMSCEGELTNNKTFIDGLIRTYVAFSGKTFPHIIIALMKDKEVMINTRKPMIIYDQMELSFHRFSKVAPEVEMTDCCFEVTGKRGLVTMNFNLSAEGVSIGNGQKQIILSGLRPYQQTDIDYLIETYNSAKEFFLSK